MARLIVQFYGNNRTAPPIINGWNYLVRLYRPRAEILKHMEIPGGAAGELNVRFLAQSGHALVHCKCPLSGIKRK